MTERLSLQMLREFAPASPALVFCAADSGSPQQDWCSHLAKNSLYRRELEEFAVLGDAVIRIADGMEPEPIEKVRILSAEYAMKTLADETDAKEFIRCVKAIASDDAVQFELEQIAAYYYREIRRRCTSEVLAEMGLLGLRMQAVTATVREREIDYFEFDVPEQKLTVAEQRRAESAKRILLPLPDPTPNYDAELAAICRQLRDRKATRLAHDEFEEFYLSDDGKSLEELDADFAAFERLGQYDENGAIGFSMSAGQRAVVVFDFAADVDASYLPPSADALANDMQKLFVGHNLGAATAIDARRKIADDRIARIGLTDTTASLSAGAKFTELPFSDAEFSDWLAIKLDELYPRRVVRSVRRLTADFAGDPVEYASAVEVNPEFEEMSYAAEVCRQIWANMKSDFHLRSLRRKAYQETHIAIRTSTDTAELAQIKKQAFADFKERNLLTLKEFTALNTAAKSQEARIGDRTSPMTQAILRDIARASANRLRYLKYFLYNDAEVQKLTRQEKQRLWDAVRERDKAAAQPAILRQTTTQKQVVRVHPRNA